MGHIIHVEDLTVSYGENPILWDADVEIEEHSLTAIIGPNGAGKSTLLKCILGFLKPLSGKVLIFGQSLSKVRDRIAYVPQTSSVNWDFPITVEDVVLMGRYSSLGMFRKPKKKDREIAIDALREMQLLPYKNKQISELSGGQKQRVFISRGLCQDADLLIMDEPLAGVDRTSEEIIIHKLKELQRQGKTVVCVHHDLNTIREYFDHVVMINRYIVASGDLEGTLTKDNLKKTYLENRNVTIINDI